MNNMQIKKYPEEISYQELETYTGIVLYESGAKEWYLNGNPHRTDGPALEGVNGYKAWFLNGQRHRTDGPAVEGIRVCQWWYQDQFIEVNSQEEFESWLKVLAFE